MGLTQVSTDGVKNDAITKTKIPANQIEASELADNAVDTNAIADQAVSLSKLPHGTSSNNGKFLRANNGADPTFETVSIPAGTTINNNADDRVITGSGTANTLNGESLVTIDSSGRLSVSPSSGGSGITLASTGSTYGGTVKLRNTTNSNHDWLIGVGGGDGAYVAGRGLMIRDETTGANRIAVSTGGAVGIGTVNPQQKLHLKDTAPMVQIQSTSYSSYVGTAQSDDNIGNGSKAGNLVLRGVNGVAIMGNNGTTTQVKVDSDGLKFGSDTAAANALDDYEEGTWTPTITGGAITANGAYYTKVGRVVHWYLYGTITNTANNSTEFRIYGLPFTVGGNTQGLNNYYGGAASINYTQSANNGGLTNMGVLAHGSTNYLYFHFIGVGDSNQPTNSYFHSHMLNQGFIIAGSYFV